MPSKIEVDGVGVVEVDDSFFDAAPDVQQATLKEIQASVATPAPQGAPAASTGAPRANKGNYQSPPTFAQIEDVLGKRYPGKFKVTSRQRTRERNDELIRQGLPAAKNSHHITGHSIDITPIPGKTIDQVAEELRADGLNITEAIHHNGHYHFSADRYDSPPGGPPVTEDTSEAQASKALQAAFDKGAPIAELIALAKQSGVSLDGLEEAIAYRDKGGKGAGFVPIGSEPAFDPDNPAGTAPPGGKSQSLWGELTDKAKQLGTGAIEGISQAGSDLVDAGGQLAFGVKPSALGVLSKDKRSLSELGIGAEDPKTRADHYARSIGYGIGGAIPTGAAALPKLVAKYGPKVVASLFAGAAGSGVGGEVAEDIAPGNPYARLAGEVFGGFVGGGLPLAKKSIDKLADKRFIDRQTGKRSIANPLKGPGNEYAAFDAEIAEDLRGLVDRNAKSALDPAGRAVVTAKEVNSLEGRYLVGMPTKIKALPIPQADKRKLFDAIEGRHSIDPAELDKLRGTVAGDAVADAIIKVKRLRHLTPEVKRNSVVGGVKSAVEMASTAGGAVAGGPIGAPAGYGIARLLLRRGAEAEAARVHSAERVIKRGPVYKKLQAKVGPSGQRESQKALDAEYNKTVTKVETDKARVALEKVKQAEAKAALDKDNARITATANRKNVPLTSEDGMPGYVKSVTGLDTAAQDQGLIMLVMNKSIRVADMKRYLANPHSLKGGAGSSIVAMLRDLADKGKLKRDPNWTPPSPGKSQFDPSMVDAKGDPIRSLPAYQGGVAKNIARELVAKHLGIKPDDTK